MKRVFTFLLAFVVMLVPLGLTASAAEYENQRIVRIDGSEIYVQMGDGSLCEWSDERIYTLLDGVPVEDGMTITIWGTTEAETGSENMIAPLWYESWTNTLVSTSAEKTRLSEMLFSVARGQTITLTRSYSSSINFKLTGDAPFNLDSLKAEGAISASYTYQRSESYTGPSDSSPYNTRAFYVKHYYRDEVWDQTEYDFALRPQGTIRTTVERPLRSINFSIDSYETLG